MIAKKIFLNFFYFCLDFTNLLIWLLIKILPNKFLFIILSKREKNLINLKLNRNYKLKIIKKLKSYFLKKEKYHKFTSCLSKSITGKVFLSIIGIKSQINICMRKNKKGEKRPHAWLYSKELNIIITEQGNATSDNLLFTI